MSDLLEALLMGRPPSAVKSHMARQHEGTYPTDLEVEGGYPSDDKVEEIRLIAWRDARRWLHDEFPRLWASVGYEDSVQVTETTDLMDRPALKIRVATGGWSGCEDVIDAVLSHHILRSHLRETLSGGAYTFIVPHEEAN